MTPGPGVTFLDHTADVGIEIEAPSLETLYHLAALGTLALLRGTEEDGAGMGDGRPEEPEERGTTGAEAADERSPSSLGIELEGDSPAALLADWLRELLFLHETEHRDYADAEFARLEPTVLRARVRTEPAARAVREIKGVTYHGLAVERRGDAWWARVIFDV